jgi:hypothetical protein
VHGIDAWHDADRGRAESARIAAVTGHTHIGVRMHWLLQDAGTPRVLEEAGYAYDATCGYNETVGYRAGTTQVFRPLGARTLLELPLHIQDGALFYPERLDLADAAAERRCDAMIAHARQAGGALTVLWHDRSHGPERFWGPFYVQLLERLRAAAPWFATASQAVAWFRARRAVRFESADVGHGTRVRIRGGGRLVDPPLTVRIHQTASTYDDVPWDGRAEFQWTRPPITAARASAAGSHDTRP